jgi:tetratricopeptide (TPR) repeat protein
LQACWKRRRCVHYLLLMRNTPRTPIKAIPGSLATAFLLAMTALLAPAVIHGQAVQSQTDAPGTATLRGLVKDSSNHPLAGVAICLRAQDDRTQAALTSPAGVYRFSAVRQGVYSLRAEMAGYGETTVESFFVGQKESKTIDLTLDPTKAAAQPTSSAGRPEFFDEPHFTVAGVTDTTNLGGHGSDAVIRNREALAQATISLSKQSPDASPPASNDATKEASLRDSVARQPGNFDANYQLGKLLVDEGKAAEALDYLGRASELNPADYNAAYTLAVAYADSGNYEHARTNLRALLAAQDRSRQEKAEPHHLLGDVDEKLGNPLEAVREYQRAADISPTESNLFDWGSELLLHRAVEPALEVFTKGRRTFPRSVRMLVGLGASWYGRGSYDQAAQFFCEASDLNIYDPTSYLLMGKMQAVETTQSDAIVERLARFARLQPQNALANYYYAVSLWKRRKSSEDTEDLSQVKLLLQKAIDLDPKLGSAYLQLGILRSDQEDFSGAISAYQQAIAIAPGTEEAHYRLAQAYRQAGETSQAQAELRLYTRISKEEAERTERQRHQLQQFVYELRDATPSSLPQ